ncbi:MAG: hypothetical protein Q4G08_07615 [Capnocytophaga sp.]|nr:hypothetical protein [Capnocytophaga sp.]
MKNNFTSVTRFLSLAGLAIGAMMTTACSDSGGDDPTPIVGADIFHLGYGVGYSGTAEGSVLPLTSEALSAGAITFANNGFNMEPSRTHRFYGSSDGSLLYNLEYGNGNVVVYKPTGTTSFYQKIGEINVTGVIGTTNPRWQVINDEVALLYNISTQHVKDANDNYEKTVSTVDIVSIGLGETLTLGTKVSVVLPDETDTSVNNLHIWRIDMPVISGNKVYIGVAKRGYDGAANVASNDYAASTLVLDYPSLQNPKIIYSTLGKGETYGYRTPSYFVDESNNVYHVNMLNSRIFKITNGEYDNAYDFDLATALGMTQVGGTGIFYAGNGIAYMPFYDATIGAGYEQGAWSVARVDLRNKTAIKMNTPANLWLRYYQGAKIGKDGKLYMALCPVDAPGNIYIFDPTNASADGFTKGASLAVSGEGFYLGIF